MGFSGLEKRTASITAEEYVSTTETSDEVLSREEEPKYNVFKQPREWWNKNYLSWRFYVTIYAALVMLVVFVLLVGLIISIAIHGVDHQSRITLYEGSCSQVKKSSLFAHLFISGMGTYMLSASAYVMVRMSIVLKKLN